MKDVIDQIIDDNQDLIKLHEEKDQFIPYNVANMKFKSKYLINKKVDFWIYFTCALLMMPASTMLMWPIADEIATGKLMWQPFVQLLLGVACIIMMFYWIIKENN